MSNNIIDGDFKFGTRKTSVTGKGNERRIGKGKKASSHGSDEHNDADTIVGKGKRNASSAKITAAAAVTTKGRHTAKDVQSGGSFSIAIQEGANTLFHAQRVGNTGIREIKRKYRDRPSILPDSTVYSKFLDTLHELDPDYHKYTSSLSSSSSSSASASLTPSAMIDSKGAEYMNLCLANFNLLFYGLGCKRNIINNFVNNWLIGEDVLEICGNNSVKPVKSLLETISSHVLKNGEIATAYASLESYAAFVCKQLNAHYGRNANRFFLSNKNVASAGAMTVDEDDDSDVGSGDSNCDGNSSRSMCNAASFWHDVGAVNSSARLSRSSAHASGGNITGDKSGFIRADTRWGGRYAHAISKLYIVVHEIDGESLRSHEYQHILSILASCESVSMIASFNSVNTPVLWDPTMQGKFRWTYVHTLTCEPFQLNISQLSEVNKEVSSSDTAIDSIISCLSKRHKEVLTILAFDAKSKRDSNSKNIDISMNDLLKECQDRLAVQTLNQLKTILSELIAQQVVSVSKDIITMHLSVERQDSLAATL